VFIRDFVDIFGFIRVIRGFIPDTGQVFIKEKWGNKNLPIRDRSEPDRYPIFNAIPFLMD